jgi:hypothetical protein
MLTKEQFIYKFYIFIFCQIIINKAFVVLMGTSWTHTP